MVNVRVTIPPINNVLTYLTSLGMNWAYLGGPPVSPDGRWDCIIWKLEHTGTFQKATSSILLLDEDACKAETQLGPLDVRGFFFHVV